MPGFWNCFCPGSQYVCVFTPPDYEKPLKCEMKPVITNIKQVLAIAFQFVCIPLVIDITNGRGFSNDRECCIYSFHSKSYLTLLTRWSVSVLKSACSGGLAYIVIIRISA